MPLEEVGWPAAPGPTRAALRIHGRGPGVWRAMCTWGRVRAVLPRRRGVRRACPLGAGGDSRRLAGTAPGRLCDVWCVKGASGARASGESAIKQCKKDFNSESRVTAHPTHRPGARASRLGRGGGASARRHRQASRDGASPGAPPSPRGSRGGLPSRRAVAPPAAAAARPRTAPGPRPRART